MRAAFGIVQDQTPVVEREMAGKISIQLCRGLLSNHRPGARWKKHSIGRKSIRLVRLRQKNVSLAFQVHVDTIALGFLIQFGLEGSQRDVDIARGNGSRLQTELPSRRLIRQYSRDLHGKRAHHLLSVALPEQ